MSELEKTTVETIEAEAPAEVVAETTEVVAEETQAVAEAAAEAVEAVEETAEVAPAVVEEAVEATAPVAVEAEAEAEPETFEQAFEKTVKRIHPGQMITGTVIQVVDGEVFVNIGYKADGVIPKGEFSADPEVRAEDVVKEGDSIDVEVLMVNDGEGNVRLSRKNVEGKKLMVVTYNCELDWILKTALDLDMDIVRIGLLNYSQDAGFRTRLDADFPVVEGYDRFGRTDEIEKLAPDVLLTNYASAVANAVPVADTIPMCPDVGFLSSIKLARRWARLLKLHLKGGWKDDGVLFQEAFL